MHICPLQLDLVISIHSPLAGRDPTGTIPGYEDIAFQSTRPSRGETNATAALSRMKQISIHSPLAGRDLILAASVWAYPISIHSPLAGRDTKCR